MIYYIKDIQDLSKVPTLPGVYIMKDSMGNIIYIGKSKNLKSRIKSYFHSSEKSEKTKKMVSLIEYIEYLVKDTDFEAKLKECSLIKKHKPIFNSQYKNDSKYVYIYSEDNKLEISSMIVENSVGPIRNKNVAKELIEKFSYIEPIGYYKNKYIYEYSLLKKSNVDIKKIIRPIDILKNKLYLNEFILSLEEQMLIESKKYHFEKAQFFYEFIKELKVIKRLNTLYEKLNNKSYIIQIQENDNNKFFYLKNGIILDKNSNLEKLKTALIKKEKKETQKLVINNKNLDYLNIIFSELENEGNIVKEV